MSKSSRTKPSAVPDPEVSDRPTRRRFTAKYKLSVLRELDECTKQGEKGAILRREGLYSSHICDWRRLRKMGELDALRQRKTGRPTRVRNPLADENARLSKQNARLEEELRKARLIIDVQKKLALFLDETNGSDD